jgi:hypothetical protein
MLGSEVHSSLECDREESNREVEGVCPSYGYYGSRIDACSSDFLLKGGHLLFEASMRKSNGWFFLRDDDRRGIQIRLNRFLEM